MVEKSGKGYILQCDYCSNYIKDLVDFQDAVDYKKANSWRSKKIGEDWFDKCPNCYSRELEDKKLYDWIDREEKRHYDGND